VVGDDLLRSDVLNVITLLAVGILMVSRVPTFSMKKLKLRAPQRLFALVGLVLFIALLISETWFMVTLVTLIYLASIPFAVVQHGRELRAGAPETPEEPVLPEDEL
jgi:CDP-diacylglycerol--serine O-phosphatidyltransferase